MEAFKFELKPVTTVELGTGGKDCRAPYVRSAASAAGRSGFTSAKFGKGSDCPKDLRALYEACNRAMLAGAIDGFWLPRELAGSGSPWVIESLGEMVRCSSSEVSTMVAGFEVAATPVVKRERAVKAPKVGRRGSVRPVVTVSRQVEVAREAPTTAVDAIFPPKAPTVTVVESVDFPQALSAYLGRLIYAPKRAYAELVARSVVLGGDMPVHPGKEWADDVLLKVERYAGKVLATV